jgi:predicted nucleotidyltransferase
MTIEFWRDWKRKTRLEKEAIGSLKAGKRILLSNLPNDKIVAIYVKGSFIMRELNKKSDVDIVVIVKRIKQLNKLRQLQIKVGKKCKPPIGFTGYSILELKRGKMSKSTLKNRAAPKREVKQMKHYKLIYGKPLDLEKFPSGDDIELLKSMIKVFNEFFIPTFEKKEFAFISLNKSIIWLTENEQRVRGVNAGYSYKKITQSVKDKNHIVHDAYRYVKKDTKDEKLRKQHIAKLKRHLKSLEKLVK